MSVQNKIKVYMQEEIYAESIDNFPYRLIFYLDKSRQKKQIPEKNLSKVVKQAESGNNFHT